ncbi:putative hydrolase [Sphingomonas changbaiensis NBRC 104936]|uniref:Putative hydrolase n=1 Tax=Sphingomonas changbaiensis NBRC 104936 TaxID=1219043 RepID=A0A0E9MQ55_9SPHN|nr:alpha/beta hydrolase [Sphingomonas changbaiensis]GAO39684.1 putative hydrolase [Sphingomonas changbaiensis NBRC 104936]
MSQPYVRPDVRMFLEFLNNIPGPKMHEVTAPEARATYAAMKDVADPPAGELAIKRDLKCGDIPLRLYDARERRQPGPVMVFFHGGGFVIGDLETHDSFCAEAARALDLPVVAVDYRLAPEHPFPAAPDDCEAATRWIATSPAELGLKVASLVLAGDSAGGNLTIVTAQQLRDRPAEVPVIVQWPIYPAVDDATKYQSFHDFGDGFLLTRDGMQWFFDAYRATEDDIRHTPILHRHEGTPPTLLITASLDPIRDQGRAYAAELIRAGVPTVYREAVGNIHGFITLRKAIPSSAGDVAACFRILKDMINEAEADRVMAEAAQGADTVAAAAE